MMPIVLLLALAVSCSGQEVTLTPTAFLKLNDSSTDDLTGQPSFGNGAATAGAYDPHSRLLYVIGTSGNVMNIINFHTPDNPQIVRKYAFSQEIEGFPDAIALCRQGSGGQSYLAVSFEKLGTSSRAFVKIFDLLDSPVDELTILHSRVNLDGYDPTGMVWDADCTRLVVIQQGRVHVVNGQFDDPQPSVDVLEFGGPSVTKIAVPIIDADLTAAGVRHVLRQCTNDFSIPPSTARKDLEPRDIVIDKNNVVYISFPKNNAIARMDLNAPLALQFISAGTKEWRTSSLDTVQNDMIGLQTFPIHTFFQPFGLSVFYHNDETYLASADTGEIYRLSALNDGCEYDESTTGQQWLGSQFFGGDISAADRTALQNGMGAGGALSGFRVTRQRYPTDGYDTNTQGFNRVTGFGGRGISLLRPSLGARVAFTSNYMEQVFTGLTEQQSAAYNADYLNPTSTPSSRRDATSPTTGPTPRAIASGELNGQLLVVAANGNVGGLYAFPVDRSGAEPLIVSSQAVFQRRGNPGLSWEALYATPGDAVGEPETKRIIWMEDPARSTGAYLAVLSNKAGAVSFYRISIPLA